MKKVFLIFLTFMASKTMASFQDIGQYRSMMGAAYKNESGAISFYKSTRQIKSSSPALLLGFKAIADLMMCNHVNNPLTKLSYFKKGKNLLEQALVIDPNHPELRFMRYCTQVNTPAILGYDESIQNDKEFLLKYLKSQSKLNQKSDPSLYFNIVEFLKSSKYCSDKDQLLLKSM